MRARAYIASLPALIEKNEHDYSFRLYVTDALKAITENGTHYAVPGQGVVDYGTTLNKRWLDCIEPTKKPSVEADNRSCGEIVAEIWQRIRGESK